MSVSYFLPGLGKGVASNSDDKGFNSAESRFWSFDKQTRNAVVRSSLLYVRAINRYDTKEIGTLYTESDFKNEAGIILH